MKVPIIFKELREKLDQREVTGRVEGDEIEEDENKNVRWQ